MMTKIQYLLVCLAEESAEVAQRATKALRFGLGESQPGQSLTNAERILDELEDLQIIVEMLREEGALSHSLSESIQPRPIAPSTLDQSRSVGRLYWDRIKAKRAKVKKYMDYAVQCGTVECL